MTDHRTILNEHDALDTLLRDLRVVSTWSIHLLQQRKVRSQLAGDLRALKEYLLRHFATEESGSYLEEISVRQPSARAALLELHQEHSVFLDQVTSLEESCMEHDEDAYVPGDLAARLVELLDMLKRHESRETALLQEVFSL